MKNIKDIIDLRKILYNQEVGDTIELTFYRNGEKMSGKMKLGEEDMLGG